MMSGSCSSGHGNIYARECRCQRLRHSDNMPLHRMLPLIGTAHHAARLAHHDVTVLSKRRQDDCLHQRQRLAAGLIDWPPPVGSVHSHEAAAMDLLAALGGQILAANHGAAIVVDACTGPNRNGTI